MRLAKLRCAFTGRRSSRWRRRLLCLLARLTAASLVLASLSFEREVLGQNKATGEYEVKAAFLFHFAQFVEWPPDAFKNAAAPLTYCTVGEDPLNGALESVLSGKNIGTHPIRVEHVKQAQELQSCQILFIGIAEKKRLAATLESVKSSPVLTVGDSEHFIQQGGIIGFCQEENKIRFEINLGAAGSARLKISARLLSLAKTVLGHSEGTA